MFSIRFWGVRGSIPCPANETTVYGGNTTCIEIRADDKLVIVDFGSGIRLLSGSIMENDFKKGDIDADVFLSHTHWDHIVGFPFFVPLFLPKSKIRIYGPFLPSGENLETIFKNLTSYNYWPISLSELSAQIKFKQIHEQTINLGNGLKVTSKYLNHPVICLGYRFEYQGKSIVTAFDTEPYWNLFPTDKNDPFYNEDAALESKRVVDEENKKILKFIKDADIVVYDSAYTEDEYINGKLNWGHSSYENAIETGANANVKKIALFHHDPIRTDKALNEIEKKYCARKTGMPEIVLATEGQILEA
ncbi:MBL fold metallo-hydrolase [Spirochaetia bacterium]|nr:MBL fold metallo-hydrolase [Spirochaetia bacterium]